MEIQTNLALSEKIDCYLFIYFLLNHELTVINHIFWES